MQRTIESFLPALERGAQIVGLEPSCVLTFRDEAPRLLGEAWSEAQGRQVRTFAEFVAAETGEGRFDLPLGPVAAKALLHGHCHQKAHDVVAPVQKVLAMIPGLESELIESSCCGMAGAFGYQAETYDVSKQMAELSLAPKVRAAPAETLVIADGTSCRHQIDDMAGREAIALAALLARSSDAAQEAGT